MSDLAMDSLYQQVILDHYRKPRNKGEMPNASVGIHMANPTCGDEVHLYLKVAEGQIQEVCFTGQGCSISQASISIMTTLLKGKPLDEGLALAQRFTAMMHGDEDAAEDRSLKNLRALQGVSKFPVRIKCALLGFDALREAAKKLQES